MIFVGEGATGPPIPAVNSDNVAIVNAADERFAILRRAQRIWAVAALHGEAQRLHAAHRRIAENFVTGDRLIYLGNYLGHGGEIIATLDEVMRFRRWLIAKPRQFASDVVLLRGSQEQMLHKLLQLQFAPNPKEVLAWMLDHGAGATITAYGGEIRRAEAAARDGPKGLARWTGEMRGLIARQPGHQTFFTQLKRAAYCDPHGEQEGLLFVHAGVDPLLPLAEQDDALWWGHAAFNQLTGHYQGFARVVRGYDRARGGVQIGKYSLTLDAGAGSGGVLTCVCLAPDGSLLHRIEA